MTEALLREFPKGTDDQPIIREYLDLRLEALASQLRSEMSGLRSELVGLNGRLTMILLGAASLIVAAIAVAAAVG